jgi:hypothetical protein
LFAGLYFISDSLDIFACNFIFEGMLEFFYFCGIEWGDSLSYELNYMWHDIMIFLK